MVIARQEQDVFAQQQDYLSRVLIGSSGTLDMKLPILSIALMAGYARAFVGPAVQLNGFVRPARAALSTQAARPSSSSSTEMSIAIVTVREAVDVQREKVQRMLPRCIRREHAYTP